ncbi:MAG TPA: hypothetical protein PKB02_07555 [Anaerohalosphaeraceae bacterium]|nr:hypothetical protein [Anaerohalosphaeraceae bacterium]
MKNNTEQIVVWFRFFFVLCCGACCAMEEKINQEEKITFDTPYYKRAFQNHSDGFRTLVYESLPDQSLLITDGTLSEGSVTLNGKKYRLGGQRENSIHYFDSGIEILPEGGKRLCVLFKGLSGITVRLFYEWPVDVPVLIKWISIENQSGTAIHLDEMQIEAFTPETDGKMSLMLENDYVRDGMKVNGQRTRSPWIEKQSFYIHDLLNIKAEATTFSYPAELDQWILQGESFQSFKVYEFLAPTENEELRGIAFRRATRKLFPWTCVRHLHCALPSARKVEEYYRGIESAADAGYEAVLLCHWWLDKNLTSPLFTNYSDYILRPELFPNGWEDVRKLTDFAHKKGLKIYFYSIYVNTWRSKENAPQVQNNNDWLLIWGKDDKSARWGDTLDPGTDWGLYVNRKLEEAVVKGGFDAWHLDGPYYGDICVAENRGYKPGGPNQYLGWERQKQFYERMKTLGYHGEAAQGFCAYPHGMSRITTTGYEEGDFGRLGMWGQILATRKGAYTFTKVYRQEQAVTFVPVVPWSPNPDAPSMEPMEKNAEFYDAYLAYCFGYGFGGRIFQRVAFEGPKSEAAVRRWLGFWKKHYDYFSKGYLLHLREPDGEHIDAIAHYLNENNTHKLLVVVYNPLQIEQIDKLELPLSVIPDTIWEAVSEKGEKQTVSGKYLEVTVPAGNATWYEMSMSKEKRK